MCGDTATAEYCRAMSIVAGPGHDDVRYAVMWAAMRAVMAAPGGLDTAVDTATYRYWAVDVYVAGDDALVSVARTG